MNRRGARVSAQRRTVGATPGAARRAEDTHYWRIRKHLPERFGQPCRPVLFGKLNSVLLEFADGKRYVTNRHFIRRLEPRERAPRGG